jgi:nucleoside-diphosphate-sugar epimerase
MPETAYATAKYATELMLNSACFVNKQTYGTSLRLSTLSGGQNGLINVDILSKFVHKALLGELIEIVGGNQRMERLDVRDAAEAIISLLSTDYRKWEKVYNVGTGRSFTILEMAQKVKSIGESKINKIVDIQLINSDVKLELGMDVSRFCNFSNWTAKHSIDDLIESLFDYQNKPITKNE